MAVAKDVSDSSRRNRVYDSIIRQWEQVASSPAPKPRSSHRRILGGQALPTRQVFVVRTREACRKVLGFPALRSAEWKHVSK